MAIYPHDGSEIKSSDVIKATPMYNIAPVKEKLKIWGVRKICSNGN